MTSDNLLTARHRKDQTDLQMQPDVDELMWPCSPAQPPHNRQQSFGICRTRSSGTLGPYPCKNLHRLTTNVLCQILLEQVHNATLPTCVQISEVPDSSYPSAEFTASELPSNPEHLLSDSASSRKTDCFDRLLCFTPHVLTSFCPPYDSHHLMASLHRRPQRTDLTQTPNPYACIRHVPCCA